MTWKVYQPNNELKVAISSLFERDLQTFQMSVRVFLAEWVGEDQSSKPNSRNANCFKNK